MAAKDFAPIADDYAFFMTHSSEAARDAAAYAAALAGFAEERDAINMLDYGCGGGEFTVRLLSALRWPPEQLALTLVEPVAAHREQAAERLADFSREPISSSGELPSASLKFDCILSNHVLYYVHDLEQTLSQLAQSLAPRGVMLLAIAGWENVLLKFWQRGFALLDEPVPYYAAEDVAAVLSRRGMRFDIKPVRFEIRFPDTPDNRAHIMRFLFGEHFTRLPTTTLLSWFDPFARDGQIQIQTHSDHFVVRGQT